MVSDDLIRLALLSYRISLSLLPVIKVFFFVSNPLDETDHFVLLFYNLADIGVYGKLLREVSLLQFIFVKHSSSYHHLCLLLLYFFLEEVPQHTVVDLLFRQNLLFFYLVDFD